MVRIKKYKSAQNVLVIKSIRFMLNDLINSSVEKYVFLNIYENAIKTFDEDARQEYVKAAKLLMKQQGINIIRK